MLFLTRDAFCRRSMEVRRTGDDEPEPPPYRALSRLFLLCQKLRGEALVSRGDDWKGEESMVREAFCRTMSDHG